MLTNCLYRVDIGLNVTDISQITEHLQKFAIKK